MKKNLIYLLLLLLIWVNSFSQFSKTHYIPPISISSSLEIGRQYLYISTPSLTPVNVLIKEVGGNVFTATVSRDNPYEFNINSNSGANQFVIRQNLVNSIQTNKGYIIEAGDIVYVSARVDSDDGGGVSNQAGALVSKGLAGLGTHFRIGGLLNLATTGYNTIHYTFITVMATQNNTEVSFADIKPGAVLINDAASGNTPSSITLDAGETYVLAVQGPTTANRDALIGSSVTSDKPIVVNCGSVGGTNGPGNLDYGFDQIVSAERTGTEYIFIKSTGSNIAEDVHIVADEDNTEVYLNDNVTTTPDAILNQGQYVHFNGLYFNAVGNLYIRTTKKVFAYQAVSNSNIDDRNQELFFVPPLSCQTPKSIDNIPFINKIGTRTFTGRVTITTKAGSTLGFILNGTNYTLASLPATINVIGPTAVTGNTNYECYTITGLTGNVSVSSTSELYLAAYGSESAATFGGYYSGFTFKPEVTLQPISTTASSCIPNVNLEISSLSGFDTFQWYFNGAPIPGANSISYIPDATNGPGYYYLSATLSTCSTVGNLISDEIPVSNCPTDSDNDGVNDNFDLDSDGDGIANCTESFGDVNVNLTNPLTGNVSVATYSNSFTGTVTTAGSEPPTASPFTGNANGAFTTSVPKGTDSNVTYQIQFAQPLSVKIDYPTVIPISDLINSNSDFKLIVPPSQTITVLNPNNQLLIDTNYDGIYESNITQYSSFDLRFRVNSTLPLAAGTGTFGFYINNATSITYSHTNLQDKGNPNNATFRLIATCVNKDSDGDGIPDKYDFDSDNDGIPDAIEAQGATVIMATNVDANNDGIDDAFGNGLTPVDSDSDTVPNYLDLDSDNDGIYDLVESGSNAPDTNLNGIIDGSNFGTNGLANSLETSPDNGVLNYTIRNTDADTFYNYLDLDSDNDNCNDVIEAGFADPNNDGIIGNNPVTVNFSNGLVTSAVGYTTPNPIYIVSAPITITTQPSDITACQTGQVTFTVASNTVNSYQWQLSTDGGTTWNNITNNATYSGATTITLTVSNVIPSMANYKYRVFLNKNGNACGLYSNAANLTVYPLPVITTPVTLVQCDADTDGISPVNLTEQNPTISVNYATDTFTYFTTQAAAQANNSAFQINNPIAYNTASTTVWVRVVNTDGCPIVGQLNVVVSATQISEATFHKYFTKCDDEVASISTDTDGTSNFNFSSVTTDIQAILPPPSSNYSITYYETLADAEAETNSINPASYRNTTPNVQQIYVRVDSNLTNACYGLGNFVTLTVEALPVAYTQADYRECDTAENDGIFIFNTSNLENNILQGQTNVVVTYLNATGNPLQDSNGNAITSPFPATFSTTSQIITAKVTNTVTNTDDSIPCYDLVDIKFTVDKLPIANSLTSVVTELCDDEAIPNNQDGILIFNTTNLESEILNGQSLTEFSITYFDSNGNPLQDLNGNPIVSPFPATFETNTQTIRAVVTNIINNTCSNYIDIPFIVHPVPNIDLTDDELVCTNQPTFLVNINAGINDGSSISNYTYVWYLDGVLQPQYTTYSIGISIAGIYTVDVINSNTCFRTRTITVVASDIAHIQSIEIIDLVDINTVTINVTGVGGDFDYALDDETNYQTSNFFNDVPIGNHTVYIRDRNGCGLVTQNIHVLGAPNFFTPNGDGINDTWNIKGISADFNANAIIYIFDRFGKLIKEIKPLGDGWDGTFNGNPMLSDDYWYTVKFENNRTAKGHFSLKR
jgi:gliding motility-associated-like protein